MDDQIQNLLQAPGQLVQEGVQFLKRCQKPDQSEYTRLLQAVGVGFLIIGGAGFVVKLIHVPLNGVLVGSA